MSENIFDFYIQMEDGLRGGDTNEVITSYALINAYSISLDDSFSDIKLTIANFWNFVDGSDDNSIEGKYIPMLLKITGKLT